MLCGLEVAAGAVLLVGAMLSQRWRRDTTQGQHWADHPSVLIGVQNYTETWVWFYVLGVPVTVRAMRLVSEEIYEGVRASDSSTENCDVF